MKKKKLCVIALALFFVSFLFGFLEINNVLAAAPTKEEVYRAAPEGIDVKEFLTLPEEYSRKEGEPFKNQATIIEKGNSTYNNPTEIIQMLDSGGEQNQIAAFWGTYKDPNDDSKYYNYFDLTKRQTISAWIYLGDTFYDETDSESGKTSDGIALVIQNDSRGDLAIARGARPEFEDPAYGETLGVWGSGQDDYIAAKNTLFNTGTVLDLTSGAIENSLALEFDTIRNANKFVMYTNSVDDFFDGLSTSGSDMVKGQHIAFGYPGERSTYEEFMEKSFFGEEYFYYGLNHQGQIHNLYLSGYDYDESANNSWRHITVDYTPPTDGSNSAHISYIYNDKNYDGTAKSYRNWDKRINQEIDISKIKGTDGNTKVRWGFTAATGSPNSVPKDYAILFQQMPNVANADASTSLYDLSQYDSSGKLGRKISDLDKKETTESKDDPKFNVSNKDKLRFDYDIIYNSGFTGTGELTTIINLPEQVDFKPGINEDLADDTIGQIIYSDGDNDKTTDISVSDITTDSDGNQIINLKLDSLKFENEKLSVQLYGQANAQKTPTTVANKHISYKGQYYIDDAMSPSFIINDSLEAENTDELTKDVAYEDNFNLSGKLKYTNGSKMDNDTKIYTVINGKTRLANGSLMIANDELSADFDISMISASTNNSWLNVGENKVQVYAVDSMNRVSNSIEYTINVADFTSIIITTDKLNYSIYMKENVLLETSLKYANNESFYPTEIVWHFVTNGEETTYLNEGSESLDLLRFDKSIEGTNLEVGKNTIDVYATDGVRKSNTLTYTIDVSEKELIAEADEETQNITVNNNDPVNLSGLFYYSDDSEFTGENGARVSYIIKTELGEQEPVTVYDAEGKINLEINPILNNETIGNDFISINKEIEDGKHPGLREGKNEIYVTIQDGTYTSNTLVYTINVPKLHSQITTDSPVITVRSIFKGNIPKYTYTYVNGEDYYISQSNLYEFYSSSNIDGYIDFNQRRNSEKFLQTADFESFFDWVELKLSTSEENNISLMTYDNYGRKSNTINYSVIYQKKDLSLDVEDYRFNPVNLGGKKLVSREGDWDVKVNSYNAKWQLFAQQTSDFVLESNFNTVMNAGMVFKDENDGVRSLIDEKQLIAYDSTGGKVDKVTDVADAWDSDEGILLQLNGLNLPGEYSSELTWTLVDSDM
ncbi:hypothetical protein [Companilactobacillus futsaii]|uniref:Uncharacterized protein n=2 Tax=Companilactobacillus futsaii TaxID=938155 RepID=A0A5B7SWY7_9LACO|nr:hypothetical protein [Companilactobacillus futsaii]KRK98939.1 hypothetical protein FC88_GL001062 [Companilactobacillus futsaii JCM 17355]QCX24198.1 hypothetical protein FG051_03335 [Companilactobacillus futsaii]